MTYEQALAYLDSLNTFGIKLGLERIKRLLELMQHPERRYKTVHVTGTNGKGSTTAMLAAILVNSGIRTGMYISPHLADYTERMTVNGQEITKTAFAEAIHYTSRFVEQMITEGGESPTQFEVLTAAAFYYFAAVGVEYAVIEVGLGGLLDSTNVIVPEAAVITNVALEHTDRCGSTVAAVAEHKAGIIKSGVPVVTGASGEALDVITKTAQLKDAPLYILGQDFGGQLQVITDYKQQAAFWTEEQGQLGVFNVNLLGQHQVDNSAAAVMVALILARQNKRISLDSIQSGLANVCWPGRFEVIPGFPVTIIDGAHNPAGAKVLRSNLDQLFPGQAVTFLLGILKDKDVIGILGNLVRSSDRVVVTTPDSDRAADPHIIARHIQARQVEVEAGIADALNRARQLALPDGILCVAGSLYLIGAVRSIICK